MQLRALSPFAFGQVAGALVIGAVGGSVVDVRAILTFAIVMAIGAAASAMICRWWPGYDAPGWRLWLIGAVANPLLLVAVGFAIEEYDCLLGKRTGWACMFSDIGPMVAGVCLLPPLLGIGLRWLWDGPPGSAPKRRPPGSAGPGSSPRPR
jgi:hypothetical protein